MIFRNRGRCRVARGRKTLKHSYRGSCLYPPHTHPQSLWLCSVYVHATWQTSCSLDFHYKRANINISSLKGNLITKSLDKQQKLLTQWAKITEQQIEPVWERGTERTRLPHHTLSDLIWFCRIFLSPSSFVKRGKDARCLVVSAEAYNNCYTGSEQ